MQTNPYQRHAEANLLTTSPLDLVAALYRGALDSVVAACRFNDVQDHSSRGRAVNKALDILMELTLSLDVSAGGSIGVQLGDLYSYMCGKLNEAHAEASRPKLMEVAELLSTLLEGWQQIATTSGNDAGYGIATGSLATAAPSGELVGSFEYARL